MCEHGKADCLNLDAEGLYDRNIDKGGMFVHVVERILACIFIKLGRLVSIWRLSHGPQIFSRDQEQGQKFP